jgi:hypothetical protein
MQNVVMWIAGVFGPFLAIMGLWMLLYADNLMKVWTAIKNSPALVYLISILTLLAGIIIVKEYNMWAWDACLLVTLLGWVFVLRGVMGLFVPQVLIRWTIGNSSVAKIQGIIPFVWGLALCWLAYFM